MQITNTAQPGSAAQAPLSNNTAVNSNTEQLSNSVMPRADTFTNSSSKIFIAQQLVTQQVEIALEIRSPAQSPVNALTQFSNNDDPVDQLLNKVVQKIHDEKSSAADNSSDEDKHLAAVKSVRVKVAQGFESATLALSRTGGLDNAAANNIAQTRSRVDAAIDQVAAQPASPSSLIAANEALPATEQTASVNAVSASRDLSTSLQLTTKEGDLVTVNFSRNQEISAGIAQGPGGSLAYVDTASSSFIEISVQGDLNAKESKSIKDIVESINKLAEKLFNGKTGAAMEKLSELNIDTEYLASMSLNMSSSFSYQAVSAYAQVSTLPVESASLAQSSAQSVVVAQPSSPVASNNTQQNSSVPVPPSAIVSVSSVAASTIAASQAAPVTSVAPAAAASSVVPVVQEAATVVNDAAASDVFANAFDALRDLFSQFADMFASMENGISDSGKNFVNDIFEAVVDEVENEQNDDAQEENDDVDDLAA